MEFKNPFIILFIVGTIFSYVLHEVLEYIDYRARCKNGTVVPTELFGYVDSKVLKKTCAYEDARYFLFIPKHTLSIMLSLILVFCGFYVSLYNWAWNLTHSCYLTAILFSILATLPSSVLLQPFAVYREFVIEKKFGFSTMTVAQWIIDIFKNLIVECVLSIPLICIAVFLLLHALSWWWLLLGLVYIAFCVGFSFVYPVWIAPLFNKFTPVESGELKTRLERLLERTGFTAGSIMVMDASRRSNHSNAYFTGFGKNKRVVLYDTLINQLSVDEIEATLGHELGHYKLHHIVRRLCVMIPLVFVLLFVGNRFLQKPSLYSGFGFISSEATAVPKQMLFIGIFLLQIVVDGFTLFISALNNISSCRDELAADRFSAKLCGTGRHLCTALIKLNKENLSEVNVPKIYSVFNYSHPPLLERIRKLKSYQPDDSEK